MNSAGVAIASFLGSCVFISFCYLSFLAYRKFQNRKLNKESLFDEEDTCLTGQSYTAIRPLTSSKTEKDARELIVEPFIQKISAPADCQAPKATTPHVAQFSPDQQSQNNAFKANSSSSVPMKQSLPPFNQQHGRHSTPWTTDLSIQPATSHQTSRRQRRSLQYDHLHRPSQTPICSSPPQAGRFGSPTTPSRSTQPPSATHHSRLSSNPSFSPQAPVQSPIRPHEILSIHPTRPVRLAFPAIKSPYSPKHPSPLRSRALSPDSSSAYLMQHPAVMGRRASEVSPGLDPEYPYPMVPGQVGDGRRVSVGV